MTTTNVNEFILAIPAIFILSPHRPRHDPGYGTTIITSFEGGPSVVPAAARTRTK